MSGFVKTILLQCFWCMSSDFLMELMPDADLHRIACEYFVTLVGVSCIQSLVLIHLSHRRAVPLQWSSSCCSCVGL